MKDINELIKKLRELKEGIYSDAEKVSQKMALNYKALAVRRLQDEGIEGKQYSDAGVPAYLIENSSYARLNSGFDRMIKEKKKNKELVSWKDVRRSQGLQTDKVDYTFTGRTMQNLTIVDTVRETDRVYSLLGGTQQETQERLVYGYDRYGDFLKPSNDEKKILYNLAKDEFKQELEKYKI